MSGFHRQDCDGHDYRRDASASNGDARPAPLPTCETSEQRLMVEAARQTNGSSARAGVPESDGIRGGDLYLTGRGPNGCCALGLDMWDE